MGVWTPGPGPTEGNDVFVGDDTAENVDAGGGDDNLNGGLGADTLNGGAGNDTLAGGDVPGGGPNPSGNDILNGGDGDDTLIHEYTNDTFNGGAGFDTVRIAPLTASSTVIFSSNLISIERFAFAAPAGSNAFMSTSGTAAQIQAFMASGFEVVGSDSVDSFHVFVNAIGATGLQFLDLSAANHVITNFNIPLQDRINLQSPDMVYIRVSTPTTAPFHITGSSNAEAILGGSNNDVLFGGGGHDIISGRGGIDQMFGGAGDDYIYTSAVANAGGDYSGETWDGGDGFDILVFSQPMDLNEANLPTITSIEGIAFDPLSPPSVSVDSAFLAAVSPDLRIEGTLGLDSLFIEVTSGFLDMRSWTLSEWDDGDEILVSVEPGDSATVLGSSGEDLMNGGSGNDVLVGGGGGDFIFGWGGDNYIDGGAGDDLLAVQFGGVSTILGGDGVDLMLFFDASSDDIYLDLTAGAYSNASTWLGLAGIEGAVGNVGSDTLLGDDGDNSFSGSLGNDALVGRGGGDALLGDEGDDWLDGGAGDDVLGGGIGVNVLIGGDGIDLASYEGEETGLWINMSAGVYSATGVWDVFFQSIEGVRGGSGSDTIFGNTSDNRLEGADGNDALIGDLGNDTLVGGAGQDWIVGGDGNDRLIGGTDDVDVLTGGAGADTFDLGVSGGWDVAFDFNTSEDRFSLGGHLWSGFLVIDADGDGQADDTLLGYAGGNFVALNVSGLNIDQWNALVDVPAPGETGGEKLLSDPEPQTLPATIASDLSREMLAGLFPEHSLDLGPEAFRGFLPQHQPLSIEPEMWTV